ncbi:MAG TPA: histidinol-phosphate transaminase [Kofleriaceae bacterium]|nr:histidinol-phosphate transaminase [Kofleriaceae bacterium]
MSKLGPLEHRVPEALRGTAAYHVPQLPEIRAKLDANELPYGLPMELRARLGRALADVSLERYPDPNASALRGVIVQELGVRGDQIVFGNGSDETIAFLIAAFAAPRVAHEHGAGGSRPAAVLYPVPSFVYYRLAAIARGVEPIEVPLTPTFELDEDAVERAIQTHRPSVVFLALPNNPTGTLWRMDFALELAARHRDLIVVSDEAYFAYCGKTNLPHLAEHPNLVIMRTLSKVGMAGVRVGYTVSSPAIAELLEKVRPPYNVSSLDQAAAVFLLTEARSWCATHTAEVVAERARLAANLAALRDVEVFPSEANLVLARFGAGRATQIWQGLADRGLLVRTFDRPGPLAGCLRITVGTPEENAALLEALRSLV